MENILGNNWIFLGSIEIFFTYWSVHKNKRKKFHKSGFLNASSTNGYSSSYQVPFGFTGTTGNKGKTDGYVNRTYSLNV